MCLVAFVFSVNIAVLIYLTIKRVVLMARVRKARNVALKVRANIRKNAILPFDTARKELNDARSLSLIQEEMEHEGSMVVASNPAS